MENRRKQEIFAKKIREKMLGSIYQPINTLRRSENFVKLEGKHSLLLARPILMEVGKATLAYNSYNRDAAKVKKVRNNIINALRDLDSNTFNE